MTKISLIALRKKLEIITTIALLLLTEYFPFPSLILNLVSIIIYLFLFFVIFGRGKRFLYVVTRDISLLLLFSLAIASLFWSNNPEITASQLRFLFRSSLLGVYLAMQYSPREQMSLLSWTAGISIILSLGSIFLFPTFGTALVEGQLSWVGIYSHKQIFGRQLGLFALIFVVGYLDKRSNNLSVIIGFLVVLLLALNSNSKTAWLMIIFSLLIVFLYKINKQRRIRLLMFLFFSLLAIVTVFLVTANLKFIVVDLLGKNLEFNGRIPIWNLSIERGLEQPWLGYGYAGFWGSSVADYVIKNSWAATDEAFSRSATSFHAHNGYIDIFLQLGFIGLLIFSVNLFITLKRVIILFIYTRSIEYAWMMQFIALFCLLNFSDSCILLVNTFWVVYVSIAFSSAIEFKRKFSPPHRLTT
ncbi:MAG: O-antigen ligase family protein [Pelatocladus maniniholoensis HA4357-MV3]|jgi:exopolysaccharide production protein ExoQ|uniref:O-antigen ligase family protein n=1 Tax=Pelatocladus maniniholoensis HA4357-MV3 TaxID=1117104 RepID=A0A9E3HA40_9NOST|nr:O-antigen ligase family protein [Pelatocladus maniniholoensis HA4357-MV3]BAZ69114.1 O-antigen polymerase [Fischerella sp. NIES-4106]